ncbi:T6SS phospholipase effector Tle1-like catalytic domain-containing protein [Flavobacterium sp. MMS24-S5]|uniref:T6SS phospholipase effector Tle1-like catalytic domain-containing protein n=1 Tax=Flavobacterium sp. MMS24-S5 TaxID=3416605 RepID=UPI003CFCF128
MSNIIFGEPRFVPPKEDYKETNDVYMGVFFDGTSNNRENIEGRRKDSSLKNDYISNKDGSNTSYGNDNTNVDRLENAYLNIPESHYYSVYVEGIGTKNPKKKKDGTLDYYGDFIRGQGYGEGETGLFEKVEKGCFDVTKKLKKETETSISTLYLDVFGFSRGAAAARIFVNELNKNKTAGKKNSYKWGYLGKAFKELDYKTEPQRIKVRFLGLFDTVSSYGSNVFDDVEKDRVPLTIPKVGFTVHLTAEDEHRKNFPLTTIASAGENSIELTLPGSHSDIGGGYKSGPETVILTETGSKIAEEKKYVLEQGWFFPHELKELPSISPYYLEGNRKNLSNGYTFVILHLMAEFGNLKCKVPWNYEEELNLRYKIPKKLDEVKKRIDEYAFKNKPKLQYYTKSEIEAKRKKQWENNKEIEAFNVLIGEHNMLVDLRNKYLHCSANMDGAGMEPTQDNQSNIIWKRTIIKG